MADNSKIAWTDHTFNPWMGCFKVSAGCKHCYAETLTTNRMGLDVFGSDTSKRRRTSAQLWNRPRRWNREAEERGEPFKVFCASLADVFEDAPGPNEWRSDLWDVIRECQWLDFQILTKRPERIADCLPDDWGEGYRNVWLGTSIEDRRVVERAQHLTAAPAIVHFISYEPAIGPVFPELDLTGIEWLICGGESGPGFRPMDLAWAHEARRRCAEVGTAFFFKQISAYRNEQGADALGEVLHGFPQSWDRAAQLTLGAQTLGGEG